MEFYCLYICEHWQKIGFVLFVLCYNIHTPADEDNCTYLKVCSPNKTKFINRINEQFSKQYDCWLFRENCWLIPTFGSNKLTRLKISIDSSRTSNLPSGLNRKKKKKMWPHRWFNQTLCFLLYVPSTWSWVKSIACTVFQIRKHISYISTLFIDRSWNYSQPSHSPAEIESESGQLQDSRYIQG